MYLNKDEVKQELEEIVKKQTDDFSITLFKRKVLNAKEVSVIFAVKVKHNEQADLLLLDLMQANARGKNLELLETAIEEENKTLKEVFFVQGVINIYGV